MISIVTKLPFSFSSPSKKCFPFPNVFLLFHLRLLSPNILLLFTLFSSSPHKTKYFPLSKYPSFPFSKYCPSLSSFSFSSPLNTKYFPKKQKAHSFWSILVLTIQNVIPGFVIYVADPEKYEATCKFRSCHRMKHSQHSG